MARSNLLIRSIRNNLRHSRDICLVKNLTTGNCSSCKCSFPYKDETRNCHVCAIGHHKWDSLRWVLR